MGCRFTDEEMLTKKFGMLTPIQKITRNRKDGRANPGWLCKCDCGKEVIRTQFFLFTEHRYNYSCGCSHDYKANNKNKGWKGVGELGAHYFQTIKVRALRNKKKFELSLEYLWSLFEKQNKKCLYSGLDLSFSSPRQQQKGVEQTASLDRIDSTGDYVEGNVVWVHKDVNKMKNFYGLDYFKKICQLIVKNDHPKYIPENYYNECSDFMC